MRMPKAKSVQWVGSDRPSDTTGVSPPAMGIESRQVNRVRAEHQRAAEASHDEPANNSLRRRAIPSGRKHQDSGRDDFAGRHHLAGTGDPAFDATNARHRTATQQ